MSERKEIIGFMENCRRLFSKEETFISLFDSLGLKDYELGTADKSYTVGERRFGVIKNLKDSDGSSSKVIVDIAHGEPSYQQIMDVIFDKGKDCDMTIIAFDDTPLLDTKEDPLVDSHLMRSFVELLKEGYGISCFLVKLTEHALDKPLQDPQFTVVEFPWKKVDFPPGRFPSERKFEEIAFWLVYCQERFPNDPIEMTSPNTWTDFPLVRYIDDLLLTPQWTNEGIFMHAIPLSSPGAQTLTRIWNDKRKEVLDQCREKDIKTIEKGDVLTLFTVKVSDVPFQNAINAGLEWKRNHAVLLLEKEFAFYNLFEDLERKIKEENREEKSSMEFINVSAGWDRMTESEFEKILEELQRYLAAKLTLEGRQNTRGFYCCESNFLYHWNQFDNLREFCKARSYDWRVIKQMVEQYYGKPFRCDCEIMQAIEYAGIGPQRPSMSGIERVESLPDEYFEILARRI